MLISGRRWFNSNGYALYRTAIADHEKGELVIPVTVIDDMNQSNAKCSGHGYLNVRNNLKYF